MRAERTRHRPWLVALVLSLLPGAAAAWSKDGHLIVCEIAWQRLSKEGRALVEKLRAADPEPGGSFADSCAWADSARRTTHRHTAEYHYINVPRGADGIDLERDCPAYDCIPIAVERYSSYLSCEETAKCDPLRRAEALKFLGHFVGDAHQPLHAGYPDDRGGNDTSVDWFGLTGEELNLHRVWDVWILRRAGFSFPDTAAELLAEIDDAAGEWQDLDVAGWLDESYLLAVRYAYDLPDDRVLGDEYFERARPVVREQLKKSGVRLAHLINSIAAGK